MERLLMKYLHRGITYALDGAGAGGAGAGGAGGAGGTNQGANNANASGGNGDDEEDGDDDSQLGPIFGSEEETDSLAGMKDVFDAFKSDDDPNPGEIDDTGDDEGDGIEGIPTETVTAMDTEIKAIIGRMKLPDTAIPADFDPNNQQQLKQLLDNTVKSAVAQTMQVVFKPVQLALNHMQVQLGNATDRKIAKASDGMKATSIVESKVPEINHPEHGAMVRDMDKSLRLKGKKPAERADILRKILNQMGIKSNVNNRSASTPGSSGNGNRQVKTGKTVLDNFFGKLAAPSK